MRTFTCLLVLLGCAALAASFPLSADVEADDCKHCLFWSGLRKDPILHCQQEGKCPIHDDGAISNLTFTIDPAYVKFNSTFATMTIDANFTVLNQTGTGEIAVKIFPPPEIFGAKPKIFSGGENEGFAVGEQLNIRGPTIDATAGNCWFCEDIINDPLPAGGYIVHLMLCNGYCRDLEEQDIPEHTKLLGPYAQKAFSITA